MKILFIRPRPSAATIGLQHLMVVEPLELEVMAALIGSEDQAEIVDMILEKKPIDKIIKRSKPDLFCVTGYITHIPIMIEYCRVAKQLFPDVKTIVGGVHVEKFPDDIRSKYVDFRMVRNATTSFPQLIRHIKGFDKMPTGVLSNGKPFSKEKLPEFDFYYPIPRRDLTKKYRKNYFYVFHNKVALVKTSFGCPFKCNFCFCRKITDDYYYERPLLEVMEELTAIKEKEIYIVDDDFLLSPKRITKFMDQLENRNIRKKYLVYGRADFVVNHPDLIQRFRNLGLRTIIMGIESFNDNELNDYNKLSTGKLNEAAMNVLNNYGIDCYAAIIIPPSWSNNDFERAESKMKELKIRFINLQPLTPLKGIGMEIDDNRLIIDRNDFAKWDLAHVTIRPEKMDVRSFYNNILHLYENIVMRPSYLVSYLKYPLPMQWKMYMGLRKVRKQYKRKIMEETRSA